MSDFVNEVSEEVRKEEVIRFWHRYKNIVIGTVTSFFLGLAGILMWQSHQDSQRLALAEAYERFLEEENPEKKKEILQSLIAQDAKGYGVLARFQLLSETQDHTLTDTLPQDFQLLGKLKTTIYQFGDQKKDKLEESLNLMTQKKSPWRQAFFELQGYLALQKKDKESAMALFQDILNRPHESQTQIRRIMAIKRLLDHDTEAFDRLLKDTKG